MSKKLTGHQIECLKALSAGPRSAYPGLHMGSLSTLARQKLVSASYGLGSMFSPQTNITWRITNAGLAAIAKIVAQTEVD